MPQSPPPFNTLNEKELLVLLKRLYVFSEKKLATNRQLSSQLTAQDVVHMAIEKTISGTRPWNRKSCPDLFLHLAGSIKSIISNEGKKKHRLLESEVYFDEINYNTNYSTPLAEDKIIADEQKNIFISIVKKRNPQLIPITKAMIIQEITKPKELSVFLNKDIHKVYKEKEIVKSLFRDFNGGDL